MLIVSEQLYPPMLCTRKLTKENGAYITIANTTLSTGNIIAVPLSFFLCFDSFFFFFCVLILSVFPFFLFVSHVLSSSLKNVKTQIPQTRE